MRRTPCAIRFWHNLDWIASSRSSACRVSEICAGATSRQPHTRGSRTTPYGSRRSSGTPTTTGARPWSRSSNRKLKSPLASGPDRKIGPFLLRGPPWPVGLSAASSQLARVRRNGFVFSLVLCLAMAWQIVNVQTATADPSYALGQALGSLRALGPTSFGYVVQWARNG